MRISCLLLLMATLLISPSSASGDTLFVVGVAVDKTGQRVSGALIRLYATSVPTKVPIAEDRTSERGVFSLYRTNIAGDIGTLFIVYEGEDDKVAKPLKITLSRAQDIFQSRTPDLVFLPIVKEAKLTMDEAAERIAAITQTQAVLVEAGVADQAKSTQILVSRTDAILAQTTRFDVGVITKGLWSNASVYQIDATLRKDFEALVLGQAIRVRQ